VSTRPTSSDLIGSADEAGDISTSVEDMIERASMRDLSVVRTEQFFVELVCRKRSCMSRVCYSLVRAFTHSMSPG
jgi:hypothetical protein